MVSKSITFSHLNESKRFVTIVATFNCSLIPSNSIDESVNLNSPSYLTLYSVPLHRDDSQFYQFELLNATKKTFSSNLGHFEWKFHFIEQIVFDSLVNLLVQRFIEVASDNRIILLVTFSCSSFEKSVSRNSLQMQLISPGAIIDKKKKKKVAWTRHAFSIPIKNIKCYSNKEKHVYSSNTFMLHGNAWNSFTISIALPLFYYPFMLSNW